jgi:hypothetical protein
MKTALVILAGILVSSVVEASPVRGTYVSRDSAVPGITDNYRIPFRGGEATRIVVTGNGDGDIDCEVVDSSGDTVLSDTRYLDGCDMVVWAPRTETFTIHVVNNGRLYSNYQIVVR